MLSRPSAGDVDRIVGRNLREASGIESPTPANVLAWSMLDMIVERDAGDLDGARGYMEELAFEEKKLETELNGCNRWLCGAGISKRAVPLSGGGTAM